MTGQSFARQSASLFETLRMDVHAKIKSASTRQSLAQLHAAFDRQYTPDQLRAALQGLERDRLIDCEKDPKNVPIYGSTGQEYAAPAAPTPPPTVQDIAARIGAIAAQKTPAPPPSAAPVQGDAPKARLEPTTEAPMAKSKQGGNGKTRELIKELQEKHDGITPAAIAKKLGFTVQTVGYHLKKIDEERGKPKAKAKAAQPDKPCPPPSGFASAPTATCSAEDRQ